MHEAPQTCPPTTPSMLSATHRMRCPGYAAVPNADDTPLLYAAQLAHTSLRVPEQGKNAA